MRLEHSFVQREDATAHLSHLETGQGLAVDFHPAVKHIDLGEQLALRTDGLHCSAEFWLNYTTSTFMTILPQHQS